MQTLLGGAALRASGILGTERMLCRFFSEIRLGFSIAGGLLKCTYLGPTPGESDLVDREGSLGTCHSRSLRSSC